MTSLFTSNLSLVADRTFSVRVAIHFLFLLRISSFARNDWYFWYKRGVLYVGGNSKKVRFDSSNGTLQTELSAVKKNRSRISRVRLTTSNHDSKIEKSIMLLSRSVDNNRINVRVFTK